MLMEKRTYLIGTTIALCSLLMSACRQEATNAPASPDLSGEAIIFTSPYSVSRASNVNTDWDSGTRVGVLGYCYATQGGVDLGPVDWNTKKDFVHADVMWNQQLTFKEGMWDYDYNNQGLREWYDDTDKAGSYKYAFFAYHPYVDATEEVEITDDEDEAKTYNCRRGQVAGRRGTISISNESMTNDPLIVYTMPHTGDSENNPLGLDRVPDLMLANTIDHKRTDGTVSLNFRHILCGLVFEVNNFTDQPVTIENLTFQGTNFYKEIRVLGQENGYSIGETDETGKPESLYGGAFHLVQNENSFTVSAATADGANITPGTQRIDATLLFITDKNGKITYTGDQDREGQCAIVVNETSHMDIQKSMSFAAGVKSIFSINYIGNDFTIQIRNSDNWEDGGDNDITFE